MNIIYNDTKKDLPSEQLFQLFMSEGWYHANSSATNIDYFNMPFINSTLVISAWDSDCLVGVVRVLSDKVIRSVIFEMKMKKQIPDNNVAKDYKGLLVEFIKKINELEQGNIISIFLTGSFARGEVNENSDLDVWCIFKELSTETLSKIGFIAQSLPISYTQLEINSQCLTLEEFHSGYFSKFLAYPIIYFEAILLFGDDIAKMTVQDNEVERIYKEFLAEILLSIRHYIAVNEPIEKLTFQKIKTWVLKPLMFALRLERYLHTKKYPLSSNDLLNGYDKPPMSILYFTDKGKWDEDIGNNRNVTLYSLHEEVGNMLIYTK